MEKKKRSHPIRRTVLLSLMISVVICSVIMLGADDAFALTGKTGAVEVVIPEGAGTDEVSRILGNAGLVRFPVLYRLYGTLRSWSDEHLAGEFTLTHEMSYDELRSSLSLKKGTRLQTRITIPEGLSTDEIIAIFVSRGIGTKEGFADAIENGGDFGYDFLKLLPKEEGRTYRLDVYLFPDTYFF